MHMKNKAILVFSTLCGVASSVAVDFALFTLLISPVLSPIISGLSDGTANLIFVIPSLLFAIAGGYIGYWLAVTRSQSRTRRVLMYFNCILGILIVSVLFTMVHSDPRLTEVVELP